MSNIIPPLLSSSPPPMLGTLDDEEDEFGDFTVAADISYGCDVSSLPNVKQDASVKNIDQSISSHHDSPSISKTSEKDFQDKRKDVLDKLNDETIITSSGESNSNQQIHTESNINNSYDNSKIKTQVDNRYNTFQYFPEVPPDIVPESINDEEEFGNIDNGFLEDFDEFQSVQDNISDKVEKNDEINISMQNSTGNLELNIETDYISQDDKFEENKPEALNESNQSNTEMEKSCISEEFANVDDTKIQREIGQGDGLSSELPNDNCVHFEEFREDQFKLEKIQKSEQDREEEMFKANVPAEVFIIDDDFGEFENHQFEFDECNVDTRQSVGQNNEIGSEKGKTNDEDDNSEMQKTSCKSEVLWVSDPFKNFNDAEFDNQTCEKPINSAKFESTLQSAETNCDDNDGDEDDFGDFNDYSLQSHTHSNTEDTSVIQKMCSMDSEFNIQQAESIILELFASVEHSVSEYYEQDFTSGDRVFGQLKDVTDTCALSYQWSKSQGQSCLLKALNIDTRNILYGPRWNESMPRYAATLGFTPLEPVKSEKVPQVSTESPATPASSHIPSNEPVQQNDIPSAQFDWVSSGLTNPLENSLASTMLLDLEQLVASLDIQFSTTLTPKSPNCTSPVNELDDWEFWLQLTPKEVEEHTSKTEDLKTIEKPITVKNLQDTNSNSTTDTEFTFVVQPEVNTVLHSDSGSVKSLQLNDVLHSEETTATATKLNNELDDFSSFQSMSRNNEESPNYSSWPFNSVVLRETHISNSPNDVKSEKLGNSTAGLDEPGWLKPTILTPDLPRKVNVTEEVQTEEDEFSDFQTSSVDNINVKCEITTVADNDDEFTDFQSILPDTAIKSVSTSQAALQPSPAILEPLKPIVVQSTVPTLINWPDPGITDDDLIRIELNYKPHSSIETNMVENKNNAVLLDNNKSKDEANNVTDDNDDDDWSDFISNQEPVNNIQPVFKTVTNATKQPSRTSTPELPLCIPQLNQISLPKRQVPVITQQGLIQTKLAAEHLVLPSVQQKKPCPQTSQPQNSFQPSLISNQFAAQFGQGLGCRNTQQNKSQQNNVEQIVNSLQDFSNSSSSRFSTVPIHSDNVDELDDEWTDFVSSQPVSNPTILPSNGFHKDSPPKLNFDWNRPPQFTSWSATVTPNIITNPVSFDSFQSYTPPTQTDFLKNKSNNKKTPNIVIQPRKNTIPSISSVPDLEFIAPKSRTWKK